MTDTQTAPAPAASDSASRKRRGGLVRGALHRTEGRIGLALVVLVAAVAFLGPFFSPHSPSELISAPYALPGDGTALGADGLGRDVLSRFLNGGNVILALALLATAVGVGVGVVLGLIAGYRRGVIGQVIMRILDIVLSFPSLLLALLFLSIIGVNWWIIVLTIAISHIPYVARVVESGSLAVIGRGFVQYAEMIGVPRRRILVREILPSIVAPLTVQFGIRVTWSIGIIASLAYLGFGRQPPSVDWGMMISENQSMILSNPLPVLLPVAAIAVVTVGANLLTDAFGQAAGISGRRGQSA
ncbi:ABC transporter permease [Amycolatopsis sp. Poz14]|uniref:ABC transporter permease n=1 Tax=Amycolatopsis sp. Poz14 TaxID=1447705 RepID=UPI001EE93FF2|nr:ABC transporter permease [Amycolatopsis sp. Poz14]MCG3754068.1 ABC transporter permease [Amycolatopsis sp. Poz14]